MYRRPRLQPHQVLALTVTALVTFLIANAFPIVELEVQGVWNSATVLDSVATMWNQGRITVAILAFVTGFLSPLLDLAAMLVLLGTICRGRPLRIGAFLLRVILTLRPWGMIEVFLLGMLVAVVKLSSFARVVPGIALWAFGVLTLLLAIISSFDLRSLWDRFDPGASPPAIRC
jgi:paraquat-inducible protein A